jgi:hypothetical protein
MAEQPGRWVKKLKEIGKGLLFLLAMLAGYAFIQIFEVKPLTIAILFGIAAIIYLNSRIEALTPDSLSKNALHRLLSTEPIKPKHKRPKAMDTSGLPSRYAEGDLQFFADFARFADIVNEVYIPDGSWEGGPWRLEELEDNAIDQFEGFSYGRRYAVYHNQFPVGGIDVKTYPTGYSHQEPKVITAIKLHHVRYLPFYEVFGFLRHVADYVTRAADKEREESNDHILTTLVSACWEIGPNADHDPSIEVRFEGLAEYYLHMVGLRQEEERERAANRKV